MQKTFDQFGSHTSKAVPSLSDVIFRSADSLAFAEYWFALPKKEFAPERAAVSPIDFPELAPNFAIYDYSEPPEVTIRLAGTSITNRYGREVTGNNLLDLVPAEARAGLLQSGNIILGQPCGMTSLFEARTTTDHVIFTESIAFPMWSKQGGLNHIISHSIASEAEHYYDRTDEVIAETKPVEIKFIDIGAGLPS